MTQQTRATNKSKFEQLDTPTGSDFVDLIDSFLSLADTTAQTVTSDVQVGKIIVTGEVSAQRVNTSALSITGNVSAPTVIATNVSADHIYASGASFADVMSAQRVHASAGTFIAVVSAAQIHAGSAAIVGPIIASSSSIFSQRIQIGDSGQRGTVEVVQRTTVLQSHTAGAPATIKVPTGSDVTDITFLVEVPYETAAGVTAADVAVSAVNGARLVTFSVSGSTTWYGMSKANAVMGNGSAYRNVTATLEAHVSIQGSNTALSAGQGILTVKYITP